MAGWHWRPFGLAQGGLVRQCAADRGTPRPVSLPMHRPVLPPSPLRQARGYGGRVRPGLTGPKKTFGPAWEAEGRWITRRPAIPFPRGMPGLLEPGSGLLACDSSYSARPSRPDSSGQWLGLGLSSSLTAAGPRRLFTAFPFPVPYSVVLPTIHPTGRLSRFFSPPSAPDLRAAAIVDKFFGGGFGEIFGRFLGGHRPWR